MCPQPDRSHASPEKSATPAVEPAADQRQAFVRLGKAVIETEKEALNALLERVDEGFAKACELMLGCRGRVVVTGMGKSGHIGGKIAATLASVGTPAFFMHPGEASHGDLGMLTDSDVVLALSNSGDTEEIITILPLIRRLGVPLITLTGRVDSKLATEADVNIDVTVPREACPMGLAPTASTTAALAMGDALAIALLDARGFSETDFARSHPGGRLGRRLLLHIGDLMHTGEGVPRVLPDAPLRDALVEMTRTRLGTTAVVDDENRLVGIFTDGDLRRTLDQAVDLNSARISEVMTHGCTTVTPDMLAEEGLRIMQERKINALLVLDADGCLVGALNMHDMLQAGVL